MSQSITSARVSEEVRLPESARQDLAKAGLRVSEPVRSEEIDGLGARVWQALVRHHGSVKALGLSLGSDPSQARREVLRLNFAQFDGRLEDLAVINAEMQAACAPLTTPQARIREQVRQVRRSLDEIESLVELIA